MTEESAVTPAAQLDLFGAEPQVEAIHPPEPLTEVVWANIPLPDQRGKCAHCRMASLKRPTTIRTASKIRYGRWGSSMELCRGHAFLQRVADRQRAEGRSADEERIRSAIGAAIVNSGCFDDDELDPLQWHHCFSEPNCLGPTCRGCGGFPFVSDELWAHLRPVVEKLWADPVDQGHPNAG